MRHIIFPELCIVKNIENENGKAYLFFDCTKMTYSVNIYLKNKTGEHYVTKSSEKAHNWFEEKIKQYNIK